MIAYGKQVGILIMFANICMFSAISVNKTPLVNISQKIPSIKIELWYATPENFTKQTIYSTATCYVHENVAQALQAIQDELALQGLGLKIWDGFRPLSAQKKLWDICPDEKYVSNPAKGGRHTRGTAVDVTIIQLSDEKELPMPTKFDDFTEKAWHSYEDLATDIKENRALLRMIMEKHGFETVATEWWHYDLKGWRDYPEIDVEL
jgi:D-alanyl-D-alanine dipeptidase